MKQTKYWLVFFISLFMGAEASMLEFELDLSNENALPSAITKAVSAAYELNLEGIKALEKKEYDKALSLFDQALSKFPEYSDAINNRGVVYFRRGHISEAQSIWEGLAAKDPQYALASYNLGLIYLHERQLEPARRLMERALRADDKLVEAHARLGMINLELGSKQKGMESLKKAYRINPENHDAWNFLAHGLISIGDTSEAITILKKKLDKHEALTLLGKIEGVRRNYQKAADYLTRAVSKGADPSVMVDLATVLVDNGKDREALSVLSRYFSLKISHSADSWLLAGIAAKNSGDLTSAQKYFENGAKYYPDDPIIRYNLGQIYFHSKNFEMAEKTWDGLDDSIQDPSLLYLRAMNARKLNQLDLAERLIKQALEMDSRAEFHDLLGVIFHYKKDDKSAVEQFRKALKINPELRSAQLNLALSSKKGEDLDAVIKDTQHKLASCQEKDSCLELSFQLSLIYYHQKSIDKAIQTLSAIKEEDRDERIFRHLALFYKEDHQLDKAIHALETASKKLYLEPHTEYELAELYLLAGYYTKAAEALNGLLPKWKQNPWRLHYQIGYSYLELNDLEKARKSFELSLKSKSNVAAQGLLAFVLNRQGNVKEARIMWEKNLKNDPSNPTIWINMGLSLEKDGNYSGALEHYKKAAMLKSDDKELQINIGNAYAGLEQYTDALNAYNQALSSGKRELAAYNIFLIARKKKDRQRAEQMAKLLQQEFAQSSCTKRVNGEMALWNGDTAKAISIFENLKDQDTDDWLLLASVYAAKANSEKTEAYLAKIPKEKHYEKTINSIQAQLAFRKGNYQQALTYLKSSTDTSFASKYNIALVAYNAGQYAEALNITEKLLINAKGKDRADCCRLAGNAAFALKKWDSARQWYMQLSGMETNSAIVQYNLAVAFYNLNDIENAWKHYTRARQIDPSIKNKDIESKYNSVNSKGRDSITVLDSTDIWYNMAVDLQNEGKDSAAEKIYLRIVAKEKYHSQAWNNLGALYGARGDIDNAEKAYFKAVEKKHDIPETYANLVNLYIELEEFVKARQWIIKGLGHNPGNEILTALREKLLEAEKAAKKKGQ